MVATVFVHVYSGPTAVVSDLQTTKGAIVVFYSVVVYMDEYLHELFTSSW